MRQSGISHTYPHPMMITQTRSCPLEPPPPPEVVPAWKLIRPRKKKTIPTDEPKGKQKLIKNPFEIHYTAYIPKDTVYVTF